LEGRAAAATLALCASCLTQLSAAADTISVGAFSSQAPNAPLPAPWQPLHFKHIPRHSRYEFVSRDGATVLEARAENSASGVARPLDIDPKKYPILRWRWKIANLIETSDPHRKSGDDYPARLYITFRSDPSDTGALDRAWSALGRALYGVEPPFAGINYIWERALPQGTILPNAHTDRVRMIVVESGRGQVGQWVAEERNVYEDYRRAFGAEPPMISGLALMTDTDDTGESATAWYGDISFGRAQP
jgi:hypothetical protein